MKNNLITRALFNSLGVLIYVVLIALFFFNGKNLFGKEDNFLMPTAMLMLFVVSATITSSLVLGKPILLYLDNQKSDALKLFFYTVGFMAIITIVVFGGLILLR